MKWDYTLSDLHEIVFLLQELQGIDTEARIAGRDNILTLGGEETAFSLRLDDEGTYYLSLVVPL